MLSGWELKLENI